MHAWQITEWTGSGLRYAFSALAVFGVLAALGASMSGVPSWVASVGAAAACLWAARRLGLVQASAIAILMFAILVLWMQTMTSGRRASPLIAGSLIAILVTVPSTLVARGIRDQRRTVAYDGLLEVIETESAPGEEIAYRTSLTPYLFYGKWLDRHPKEVPAEIADITGLQDWMHRAGIRLFAVGPVSKQWVPVEVDVIESDPKRFTRIFGADVHRSPLLYRLSESDGGLD